MADLPPLDNAVRRVRMPPDWWNALRRAEARARAAYERVVKELFGCFRAGGQPEAIAWANAEAYARERVERGGAQLDRPQRRAVKG